jgi:signal transduction histidine kinase
MKWMSLIIVSSIVTLYFCVNIWTGGFATVLSGTEETIYSEMTLSFTSPLARYFYIYLLLIFVLDLAHLEMTLRASSVGQRWQIKYVIFGAGGILAFFIYRSSQMLLLPVISLQTIPLTSAVILICVSMMALFIVKNRLFNVDIFVSRYVVYNSLTILIVGFYLLSVGIVVQIINYFEIPFNYFITSLFFFGSILLLTVALFSSTARRRVQLFINRHFYKHKYEFRDKWMETTEKISSRRSVQELSITLTKMIRETMVPAFADLWLSEASSGRYVRVGDDRTKVIDKGHPLLEQISDKKGPFLIVNHSDPVDDKCALCAPLLADSDIIGFMLLGRDISGEPYREDDFELLRAVTTQAALQINNIRLTQELMAAKEIEAFHRMSSFIMHDLKNLTNSLSLVSQNAKHHISNPEFQQDTIKTIDSTVSRMKSLIERLSYVPREPELRKEMRNIRALVDQSALGAGILGSNNITFCNTVNENMLFCVDPDAMEMVFLNLFKNGTEAIQGSGEIRVDGSVSDNWIVLSISDSGPGMSQEFIENSLFRPFKSTKKGGFGIGLYQCKAVIEVHGGKISVDSVEGHGTTFIVRLPLHG